MIKVSMCILLLISFSMEATAQSRYSSMYIFGDSLIDLGNNIMFPDSLAKANFLPYGIDFSRGPTGRFCNGKIIVDFLGTKQAKSCSGVSLGINHELIIVFLFYVAKLLGLPLIPSYVDTTEKSADTLPGVNYASAGAGMLNDTGYIFGRVIPLTEQRGNFKKTVAQLRENMQVNEVRNYLANALVLMDIGSNDYLLNYLQPGLFISSHIYNPQQFQDLLVKLITQHIMELQGLGLRKFLITEASPVGCAPIIVSNGECKASWNDIVQTFNQQLKPLAQRLKAAYPGSSFMVAPSFQIFNHVYYNAEAYGFKVKDKACCGYSINGGTIPLCYRGSVSCENRDEYMFWDSAHPSEAANRVLAHLLYNSIQWQ